MNSYAAKLELPIDWSDIDAFGHVNNLIILKYAQTARVNYLEAIGLMKSQKEEGKGPILASINGQFKKPLFYPGRIRVYSRVSEIRNTSFEMNHHIYNGQNEVAAEVRDIIVYYDFNHETKLIIPESLRSKLQMTPISFPEQ